MVHSSCSNDPEIRSRSVMTWSAMQSLDRHLWRSRITNKIKLHTPIMPYGSECWAINQADIQRIDAVDQWCLRRIVDIRWHDFVRNADIRRIANQPPLSSIIKSRQGCPLVHFVWPDPTQPISWLTQPLQVGKLGPKPTQPNTTNNLAYSLVMRYFYTKNLSCTFSQPRIDLFMFFTDHYTY